MSYELSRRSGTPPQGGGKLQGLTEFEREILRLLHKIPRGKVTTYGEMARAVGRPGAARAAGNALHKNPDAPRVPCHRVVKSDGNLGGYAGGTKKKIALLAAEGVVVENGRVVDFRKKFYRFG
jgi:methylated-DNA-[protein]-cysteine S-methyltransferase